MANWFVLNMPESEPAVVSARGTHMYVCVTYLALELKTIFSFKRLHTIHPSSLVILIWG
jgi:hypothetical protein